MVPGRVRRIQGDRRNPPRHQPKLQRIHPHRPHRSPRRHSGSRLRVVILSNPRDPLSRQEGRHLRVQGMRVPLVSALRPARPAMPQPPPRQKPPRLPHLRRFRAAMRLRRRSPHTRQQAKRPQQQPNSPPQSAQAHPRPDGIHYPILTEADLKNTRGKLPVTAVEAMLYQFRKVRPF
jgi:hypothetical protein